MEVWITCLTISSSPLTEYSDTYLAIAGGIPPEAIVIKIPCKGIAKLRIPKPTGPSRIAVEERYR
jgi:hypothetical protein